jgi:uncharacterized protein YoxC
MQGITLQDLKKFSEEIQTNIKTDLKEYIDQKTDDILDTMNTFATDVENRFQTIDQRFQGIEKRLQNVETDTQSMKSQMVTKDYLDNKLADLRGDLVLLTRKEDKKVTAVVEMLYDKKILSKAERKEIFGLDPFPTLTH